MYLKTKLQSLFTEQKKQKIESKEKFKGGYMEDKKEVKSTISKTKTVDVETKKGGKYSYRYTELADINEYIEELGERYYQYVDRIDNDDYIVTVRQKDGKDSNPIRGCRIVQATITSEYSNPAQEQGSALTYARRYSLLMAYGLATEDDDAQSLNREKKEVKIETLEEAESYVLPFGKKHKGKTLKEIFDEDPEYLEWLLNGESTDVVIKNAIELIFSKEEQINDEMENQEEMMITKAQKQYITGQLSPKSLETILKKYNAADINALTWKQANEVYNVIDKELEKRNKAKEEAF
jgi:hypothetical protein